MPSAAWRRSASAAAWASRSASSGPELTGPGRARPSPVHRRILAGDLGPRMFLKICGIQTPAEAEAALAAGAAALGVLVGLTHAAEDKVEEAAARDIIRATQDRVETV